VTAKLSYVKDRNLAIKHGVHVGGDLFSLKRGREMIKMRKRRRAKRVSQYPQGHHRGVVGNEHSEAWRVGDSIKTPRTMTPESKETSGVATISNRVGSVGTGSIIRLSTVSILDDTVVGRLISSNNLSIVEKDTTIICSQTRVTIFRSRWWW
jgi:hypothetical protein